MIIYFASTNVLDTTTAFNLNMLNRKNRVLKMTGTVQGVFYRATAHKIANEIGVFGFVTNMPDGSVLLEAEGTDEQLIKMIDWCKKGPPNAEVIEINIQDGVFKGYKNFNIRY